MPITAEQSYALGTPAGRDRINQQLRADPRYLAFLRSIGVNTDAPFRLSDQQRREAQDWVRRAMGSIGSLEIDASGNLNNPQGFATALEQWGLPAAAIGGIAALPFLGPALAGAGAAGGGVPVTGASAGEIAATSAPLGAGGVTAGPVATAAGAGTAGTLGTSMASRGVEAAGGGVGNFLKNLATPENAAGLAALIAGLTGGQDFDAQSAETKRINAINEARMRRVDPLHQVATKLAFGRLPTNYRQGVNLTDVPLPE